MSAADHRIAIIGAGLSGIGMAIKLRERGIEAEKAAGLFGIPHRRVDQLSELAAAFRNETCLIEVRTDRHTGPALRDSLHDAVRRAVSQ